MDGKISVRELRMQTPISAAIKFLNWCLLRTDAQIFRGIMTEIDLLVE